MGCISSKGIPANEFEDINLATKDKRKSKSGKKVAASSKRDNLVDGSTARLISGNAASAGPNSSDDDEKGGAQPSKVVLVQPQAETVAPQPSLAFGQPSRGRISSLANGEKGALVVAGWPSWLVCVAGEAINGWLPRKADSFQKLDKIGQGTYSSVYKARDLKTNKIVALKKVRFANADPESVRFMAREIIILRRLDHPNVMKLEGLITSRVSGSLYLIFEYMEHDLVGIGGTPGSKFTEPQIKCYMQQLLRGLEHCHNCGVLHRDIKGSNLLIDHNGNLKIGDFGLATFFSRSQKQPLTSRVVTLWYRPPELLLGATQYGDAVDLWSTGCILAELFTGKPIMPGRTEVEQLHKIFKLCGSPSEEYWKKSKLPHATIFKPQRPYKRCIAETFKEFPSSALALLDILLAVEPEDRGTASSALQSEFFSTAPLPCDPSSLPKYPPSKEFDTKLREEESRRKMAKGGTHESVRNASREPRAKPAPEANAELQSSIQKRLAQENLTSISECFNPEEDGGAGFCIEPSKGKAQQAYLHTDNGSSRRIHMNGNQSVKANACPNITPRRHGELKHQASNMQPGATDLRRFSNSVAVRGSSCLDLSQGSNCFPHWPEEHLDSGNGAELSEKYEWSHHLLDQPTASCKKNEQPFSKESTMGYIPKKNRIHYSGPLIPPGGNLEEMLKQHERRIQDVVRKARVDKTNTHDDNGQTESLLHGNRGR